MNRHPFQDLMREAARLTRTGSLQQATEALQRALAPRPTGSPAAPTSAPTAAPTSAPTSAPTPAAGEWLQGSHSLAGLSRDYRLFLPAALSAAPRPLLVMLHGCTQNPEDFAAGTAMNQLASAHGMAVLYPAQAADANPQRCWNWFKHNHQQAGRGEPGLIASLCQVLVAQHGLDRQRVYAAGLSAGGAMAALLAATHPELLAAVGVHSGLAAGMAQNLPEALAAMQGQRPTAERHPAAAQAVPTIVFHGDQDSTVHPLNGEWLLQAALAPLGDGLICDTRTGVAAGGRRFTQRQYTDARGLGWAEHWAVHGGGHAWSGGSTAGSFTDARGPDASREMLRFFLARRLDDRSPSAASPAI